MPRSIGESHRTGSIQDATMQAAETRRPTRTLLAIGVLALCGLAGIAQAGDDPLATLPELVRQLDDADFASRQAASRKLSEWTARPEIREKLAAEVERLLLSSELSFEARSRLLALSKSLPTSGKSRANPADAEQVETLLAQLSADEAGVRSGAAARLRALVGSSAMTPEVMLALKARLAQANLDSTSRKTLRELLDQARGVWLASDPGAWKLPPVSSEQIQVWIDALARPVPGTTLRSAEQEAAERELIDLLARDEYAAQVREALETRLAQPGLDVDAAHRLEAVHDWTKPAMVAEFWQGYFHISIQHLLVDVPSVPEGGVRASHFDRIDDQVAHCVSGNTLAPGDHPVGVFFPHPQQGGAQFHLVNLPTTRKRLAYEHNVRARDDRARGREIVDRTLERLIATRQPLSNATILMLEELDEGQVSAFTGRYFAQVDDSSYPQGEAQFIGNLSRHQNLCAMLARHGQHQAIPGLLAAIKANRFLAPPRETPIVWPWVAALCITVHDPWDEVDEFLAGLIEKTDPLLILPKPAGPGAAPTADPTGAAEGMVVTAPDVGATSAAILLSRHGIPPTVFGLELLSFSPLLSLDCPGSHFRDEKDRARVLEWWRKHKAELVNRDAQG